MASDNHGQYWMEDDYHVVHIYAVSADEGGKKARAGYGINWGPGDVKNRGGTAVGRKTKLRAELTALRWSIEAAIAYDISQMIIRHKSPELSDELEKWVTSPEISEDDDLLDEFGALREYVEVWVEESGEVDMLPFKLARRLARRSVGMHSGADDPLTNELWTQGIRTVDLFAAERIGCDAVAAFGVYWGPDDPRNLNGQPPGCQNRYRAYLTALGYALSAARESDLDELIVRSRCPSLLKFVRGMRKASRKTVVFGKNKDIVHDLELAIRSFRDLRHLLPTIKIDVKGQTEAEKLAREIIGNGPGHVAIWGKGTSRLGDVAKFGVYWGPEDPRNIAAFLCGQHGDLCAEMRALGTALQTVIAEGHRSIKVHTRSGDLKMMLDASRADWKRGAKSECTEMGRLLDALLAKVPHVQICVDQAAVVDEVRRFADSDPPDTVVVRTFGTVLYGNNEPDGWYGVFWAPGDSKNQAGRIRGVPSLVRAQLIAIRRAIEIALENRITRIIVESDYRQTSGEDQKLIAQIRSLIGKMQFIKLKRDHNSEEFYSLLRHN